LLEKVIDGDAFLIDGNPAMFDILEYQWKKGNNDNKQDYPFNIMDNLREGRF